MRLLVLGGTKFLGRHVVEEALARDHDVTLFNRGQTNPGLFEQVEHLTGDRDGDLSALAGHSWDAVIDTCGYVPRQVAASTAALASSCAHYAFVSSMSVYADVSQPGDEDSPVAELSEPGSEDIQRDYGALKALCEQTLREAMPDRALVVRPGLIVGPHDPTNRFTYWPVRIARGGDVLAPEPQSQPAQVIDARDLAAWMLDLAQSRTVGTFNAIGPEQPLTMGGLLELIRATVGPDANLVWAGEQWLVDQGVEVWSDLPLWVAPGVDPSHAAFMSFSNARALAAGLHCRPLEQITRDTLDWARSADPVTGARPGQAAAGITPEREQELLTLWRAQSSSSASARA